MNSKLEDLKNLLKTLKIAVPEFYLLWSGLSLQEAIFTVKIHSNIHIFTQNSVN